MNHFSVEQELIHFKLAILRFEKKKGDDADTKGALKVGTHPASWR